MLALILVYWRYLQYLECPLVNLALSYPLGLINRQSEEYMCLELEILTFKKTFRETFPIKLVFIMIGLRFWP